MAFSARGSESSDRLSSDGSSRVGVPTYVVSGFRRDHETEREQTVRRDEGHADHDDAHENEWIGLKSEDLPEERPGTIAKPKTRHSTTNTEISAHATLIRTRQWLDLVRRFSACFPKFLLADFSTVVRPFRPFIQSGPASEHPSNRFFGGNASTFSWIATGSMQRTIA
jgi:hypothetical protein